MPSRKIISILILASALVASVILASGKKTEKNNRGQIVTLKTPEVKLASQSTGDWKKDLSVLPTSTEVGTSSGQTLTDQVSQSLVANYLSMKQQGKLDDKTAQNLINQASESALQPTPNKFNSSNIIILQDNSSAAVKQYGTALGGALKINLPPTPRNEILIFSNALRAKDESSVSQLMEIAKTYKNIASDMSKIVVPSSYASPHLTMINNLQKTGLAVEDMAAVFADPMRGLQAIYTYQQAYTSYLNSTIEIKTKILNDGVVYKQGESGYYFYFGI